jgi:CP family cyanate transporter-like MFS transporter
VGICIAVLNYELPAWVKSYASNDAGLITGIYVTIMGIFSAIAVAITVPLAHANRFSWKFAMVPWIVIGLISTAFWLRRTQQISSHTQNVLPPFWESAAFKSPIAWALVLFFGLESASFHASAAWLPTILTTKDFSLSHAALMISISGIVGSLVGLVVPHFVSKVQDQRLILITVAAGTAISFFMITVQSGPILLLWLILSNTGVSISFPVALLLCGSKSSTPEGARNVSTMMQSIGYVISALGPVAMGAIFDHTANWNSAMYLVVSLVIGQMAMGAIIGKPSQIPL